MYFTHSRGNSCIPVKQRKSIGMQHEELIQVSLAEEIIQFQCIRLRHLGVLKQLKEWKSTTHEELRILSKIRKRSDLASTVRKFSTNTINQAGIKGYPRLGESEEFYHSSVSVGRKENESVVAASGCARVLGVKSNSTASAEGLGDSKGIHFHRYAPLKVDH
jgi:hypothetical protein